MPCRSETEKGLYALPVVVVVLGDYLERKEQFCNWTVVWKTASPRVNMGYLGLNSTTKA
jgi:hypothetical protein